jgi:hypothetical protein
VCQFSVFLHLVGRSKNPTYHGTTHSEPSPVRSMGSGPLAAILFITHPYRNDLLLGPPIRYTGLRGDGGSHGAPAPAALSQPSNCFPSTPRCVECTVPFAFADRAFAALGYRMANWLSLHRTNYDSGFRAPVASLGFPLSTIYLVSPDCSHTPSLLNCHAFLTTPAITLLLSGFA